MVPFDYIHATDCDCNTDNGGPYATRLSRIRHEKVEQMGASWEDVVEKLPDGSCLAWMNEAHVGQGWPGDHRDYHLIRTWTTALAERESHSTYEARDALAEALSLASWGSQPDGSFVTRHSLGIASGRYVHTLHAPNKRGPLAQAVDAERTDRVYLRELREREEAWAHRLAEKEMWRTRAAAYEARRLEAGRLLGEEHALEYTPGQEGGSVWLSGKVAVSARGALRAYGYSREVAEERLYPPSLTTEDGCNCGSGGDAPQNHSDWCVAKRRWDSPEADGFVRALSAGGLCLVKRDELARWRAS